MRAVKNNLPTPSSEIEESDGPRLGRWHVSDGTFPPPAKEQRLDFLEKRGQDYFSKPALLEATEKSHGFSMAYVQEIIVNALLESARNGTPPSDTDLLRSLHTLRSQRKNAAKKLDALVETESVGFTLSNGG